MTDINNPEVSRILATIAPHEMTEAKKWAAGQLVIPPSALNVRAAVAYVVKHFTYGGGTGWQPFLSMIYSDRN